MGANMDTATRSFNERDTIAAIATAPGAAAISIIRLSGPDTYPIIDHIFHAPAPPASQRPPGTFIYGQIRNPHTQEPIDDVILLIFRAPHSYTGEDSVEIQGHGGIMAAKNILSAVFWAGARQAEPGEFTKRAFLNNKMDLTQAESVLDLIHARSERAAQMALSHLHHAMGNKINHLYDQTVHILADLEAMLDFPDDELPQIVPLELENRAQNLQNDLQTLLSTWNEGRILRDGAKLVIAGRPNAGKSTLLNLLLGANRAIVSPTPGTTRDTIEETIAIQGYPVHVTDTAGIRTTTDPIEQEGVARTYAVIENADICLYLLDASQPLQEADRQFLAHRTPENTLILLNKIDLGRVISDNELSPFSIFPISLKNAPDTSPILNEIAARLSRQSAMADHANTAISDRQKSLLTIALDYVAHSIAMLKTHEEANWILAANHLQVAIEQLALITGKEFNEDTLNALFSRFCVGK